MLAYVTLHSYNYITLQSEAEASSDSIHPGSPCPIYSQEELNTKDKEVGKRIKWQGNREGVKEGEREK